MHTKEVVQHLNLASSKQDVYSVQLHVVSLCIVCEKKGKHWRGRHLGLIMQMCIECVCVCVCVYGLGIERSNVL